MIHFTNTYRPLPKKLTIRDSGIHGLGLFAIEDISTSTDLGAIRINIKDEWIRTPLGGFINHSEDPNCLAIDVKTYKNISNDHWSKITSYDQVNLITRSDIKAGDELLLRYTMSEYGGVETDSLEDIELQGHYKLMQESFNGR